MPVSQTENQHEKRSIPLTVSCLPRVSSLSRWCCAAPIAGASHCRERDCRARKGASRGSILRHTERGSGLDVNYSFLPKLLPSIEKKISNFCLHFQKNCIFAVQIFTNQSIGETLSKDLYPLLTSTYVECTKKGGPDVQHSEKRQRTD